MSQKDRIFYPNFRDSIYMHKPKYQEDLFPHWYTQDIRFRDLDPLNHVNNAIFNTYYEEARISFIRIVPELADQMSEGYSFVLATISINYVKPVTYPAKLRIGSGVKKLGNSSITSFQAIYHMDTKELVSVAEASGVWFDLDKQRPSRLPEIEKKDKYMIEF
ncbi:MAG: thioesterase family protein [Balneolaceae bacterium]|nr:thioesterase family protein [Balneolaceae bacterium]